jgi:hypothetical protein
MMGGDGRSTGRRLYAKRVDDTPQQPVTHGDIHHAPEALDFIPRVQIFILSQENNTNLVLIHVERDARLPVRKTHEFFEPHARQSADCRDRVGDGFQAADFTHGQRRRVALAHLAQIGEGLIETSFKVV